MRSQFEINTIYLFASDEKLETLAADWSTEEFDTSCPYVPFGFVRIAQERLDKVVESEKFWGACLAADSCIDLLPATIRLVQEKVVRDVFRLVEQDLERVNLKKKITFPLEGSDWLEVESACKHCGGHVLLARSSTDVFYLHWHRES
ncbi:MAG TPA: hypothetical protein VM571_00800 [Noviherbaspirillum sp.]|nr:hypothetical protein [Noviherbaspirillum sp.]